MVETSERTSVVDVEAAAEAVEAVAATSDEEEEAAGGAAVVDEAELPIFFCTLYLCSSSRSENGK